MVFYGVNLYSIDYYSSLFLFGVDFGGYLFLLIVLDFYSIDYYGILFLFDVDFCRYLFRLIVLDFYSFL